MRIQRKSTTPCLWTRTRCGGAGNCTASRATEAERELEGATRRPIFSWFPYRGWLPGALGAGLVVLSYVSDTPLNPLGLLWIAAGWWVRLGAAADNGNDTNDAGMPLKGLATQGWYAWSRNPMYLANGTIAWGVMIWSGAVPLVWQLVLLGAMYMWYTNIVREEERRLSAKFGGAYQNYRQKAPRWIPLWNRVPPPGQAEMENQPGKRRAVVLQDSNWSRVLWIRPPASSVWRFQWANLLKTLALVGCVGMAKWF